MNKFHGAVAVTITPLTYDDRPDFDEIAKQTEELCKSDVGGIFPCSSTGLYPAMSLRDKTENLRIVAEVNNCRKTLYAGACGVSLEEIKQLIIEGKNNFYDACVICPPYYYPLKQDEVLAFYKEVCSFEPTMQIFGYNVPFFTTPIELDTFAELLKIPNFVGLKDSSGNMKKIAHECELASEYREDFSVFTGTDDCLLPALVAGCKGCMTALSATLPGTVSKIIKLYEQGDVAEAKTYQDSILPLLRAADELLFPNGYQLIAKAEGLKIGHLSKMCDQDKAQKVYTRILENLKKVKK